MVNLTKGVSMDNAFGVILAILILIVGLMIVGLVIAFPVMWLWNYAVVAVFGLPAINWGQAWALMVLSGILFKNTASKS